MTTQEMQQENVSKLAETLKRIDYAAAAKAWREWTAACILANDINGAVFAFSRALANEEMLAKGVL